ncbi:MAG: ABC transporter substrate-binding protein [Verrucomicrobia bacterium]|nr:ABC transporter substrate-binding protein [Verrucomicrobiota bacterium]|tara:strand:- start:450 stop:2087 length:1638 start_codon:yes stop_codon:yes gene_type:complete
MKKIFTYLFVFSLFFSACKNESTYVGKKIFRYNVAEGITSLDPAAASRLENISAVNQLFNGLVQMDDKLNILPCIANRWEVLDSGLRYRFHLKDSVYFHKHWLLGKDSTRLVEAKDFQYSFNRLLNPEVLSAGKWVMNSVARKQDGSLHIATPDRLTLDIYLKGKFPPFLGILSMMYCAVVPKEITEHYGSKFRSNPIGTGPFTFKFWKENTKLIFLKNAFYFEKDSKGIRYPYLDAVAISFIKDQEVSFLKFVNGEFDYLSGLQGSYKDELLSLEGTLNDKYVDEVNFMRSPYLNTEYLGFLHENVDGKSNPVQSREIRRAINYGFDRQKMLRYLRNGIGYPALSGFIPFGLPSFNEERVRGYSYQPDSVRILLERAGYPRGKGLDPIDLNTTPQYLDICEYVQHQLGELGIPINVVVNQAATNNELIANSRVSFFRKSWVGDYPDAENYLSLFRSANFAPDGPNYTHFNNLQYDQWYEKAMSTTNDSLRYNYYQKMDSLILSEAVVVPLFYDEVVRFTQKGLKGLGTNAMNLIDLRSVQKDPD